MNWKKIFSIDCVKHEVVSNTNQLNRRSFRYNNNLHSKTFCIILNTLRTMQKINNDVKNNSKTK